MSNSFKLEPQSEFILVEVDAEKDEVTGGGIIIPSTVLQNKKTQTGVIKAVGPGRRNPNDLLSDGHRVPIDCSVGDRILFAVYIGYPIRVDGVDHVLIKHSDIMAIVRDVV